MIEDAMQERKRILIVEDSKIAQVLAKKVILSFDNIEVDVAGDGESAINMFSTNSYKMIFMDIGLPGMDGIQATLHIRELEQTGCHIPIIALTANEDAGIKEGCIRAGMDDYLQKPLLHDDAKYVIDKYLQGY